MQIDEGLFRFEPVLVFATYAFEQSPIWRSLQETHWYFLLDKHIQGTWESEKTAWGARCGRLVVEEEMGSRAMACVGCQ